MQSCAQTRNERQQGRRLLAVLLPLSLLAAVIGLGVMLLRQSVREKSSYAGRTVLITEVCAKNLTGIKTVQGDAADWVELTNVSGQDIDMTGWHMSDDPHQLARYTFPDGFVLPGQGNYITTLWATGPGAADENEGLHLNFRLDRKGETLYLSDADGNLVDTLTYPRQEWDVSFGRLRGSVEKTGFFAAATPAASNPTSFLEQWRGETLPVTVSFSQPAGLCEGPFDLTLSAGDPQAIIVYTTDGSDPAEKGTVYQRPVRIKNCSGEENRYVNQCAVNDISPLWVRYGVEQVEKCTVVKARAFKDEQWGPLCAATYWVDGAQHTLPVVSVSADPQELFGSEGIYTTGSTYYTAKKYDMAVETPGNNISGVEIAASIEMYDTDGSCLLNDTARLHIAGEASRMLEQQKSLSIKLDHDSFTMDIGGKAYALDEFTLRGRGCGTTYLSSYQDAFLNDYLEAHGQAALGTQQNIPVVLYLEGEYWGIYTLREKKDAALMDRHYGVDWDRLVWLSGSRQTPEALAEATAVMERIRALDCNSVEDMAWVEANFDLDNIISAVICNLYTNNFDGALVPNHNVIMWKTQYQDDTSPYADGRWRTVINDLDVTFVDPENRSIPEENRLKNLIEDSSYGNDFTMMPKLLVHTLWGNADFRLRFVRACVEQLQTIYATDTIAAALAEWRALLTPETEQNLLRLQTQAGAWAWFYEKLYGESVPTIAVTMQDWNGIMDDMLSYVSRRGDALRGDLWLYCEPEMTLLAQEGMI